MALRGRKEVNVTLQVKVKLSLYPTGQALTAPGS
jgi:hypothetical protein